MITNLQVLRAFAALAIVYYHTDSAINGIHTDFMAVQIFFVLSGFIMAYVSEKSSSHFLIKRLIRIVPLYWMSTILFLVLTNLGLTNPVYVLPLFGKWLIESPIQILVWIQQQHGLDNLNTLLNLVKSLLFIPYVNHGGNIQPILGVGWTLNLEMFFYMVVAVSLKASKKYAPIVTIVLLGLTKVAVQTSNCASTICSFYAQNAIFCFVTGIICFYIWNAISEETAKRFKRLLIGSAVVVATLFFLLHFFSIGLKLPQNIYPTIHPPLIILLAALLHKANVQCHWKPILIVANASYALYLTHIIFIEIFRNLSTQFPLLGLTTPIGVILILTVSSLFAIVVYQAIELPLLKLLRKRFAV